MKHDIPGKEMGYTDAGSPTSTYQDKTKRMRAASLLDSRLSDEENLAPTGHSIPGGFLKRNNFGDRC